MSDCTNGELRDLLPELMHGTLDAESRRAVEAHVASCAECAEELALLRSLRSALEPAPRVDVQRIAAAVNARTTNAPTRDATRAPWRIAIAAAALLAVGAVGYAVSTRRQAPPTVAVVPAPGPVAHDSAAHSGAPAPAPGVAVPLGAPPRETTQVATAPMHAAPAATFADAEVLGNLADLSDVDLQTLTASLDTMSALPDVDPGSGVDPLGASLDDLSGAGR